MQVVNHHWIFREPHFDLLADIERQSNTAPEKSSKHVIHLAQKSRVLNLTK